MTPNPVSGYGESHGPSGRMADRHVLIVQQRALLAQALAVALERATRFRCSTVTSAEAALEVLAADPVDVVLIETEALGQDDIALCTAIKRRSPRAKVMAFADAVEPKLARAALSAGFQGFLTKDTALENLTEALSAALHENIVVNLDSPREERPATNGRDAERRLNHLTPREREVLELLVRGATTEQIAARLAVTPNTARTHIQNVLTKLQVRSRLEAAVLGARHGSSGSR